MDAHTQTNQAETISFCRVYEALKALQALESDAVRFLQVLKEENDRQFATVGQPIVAPDEFAQQTEKRQQRLENVRKALDLLLNKD